MRVARVESNEKEREKGQKGLIRTDLAEVGCSGEKEPGESLGTELGERVGVEVCLRGSHPGDGVRKSGGRVRWVVVRGE